MANAFEQCRFFCINCGNEGIPIQRKKTHKKEQFHRKKLYCPYCKTFINHIECRDNNDIDNFKNDFWNGVFINEALESMSYVKDNLSVLLCI